MEVTGSTFVIISSYRKKVREQVGTFLSEGGIPWCTLDEIIQNNNSNLISSFMNILDDRGKKCYRNLLEWRIRGLSDDFHEFDEEFEAQMYTAVPAFRRLNQEAVYVDVGAYIGDTIEKFIWDTEGVCKEIIAFEPNPSSYERLCARSKRLSSEWGVTIDKYPYAVGESMKSVSFCMADVKLPDGDISSRKSVSGETKQGITVNQVSLDGHLKNYPVSQIKIDVMGAEKSVILGALDLIRDKKPNIVIASGYSLLDLPQVGLLLHETVSDYRFTLKSHRLNASRFLYAWTTGE